MSDELKAAAARRAAYVRALQEEREGYVRSGRTERVAAVDAELAAVAGVEGRSETPQPVRKPRREAR